MSACEPCGKCRQRWADRKSARARAALLRAALKLLSELASCLESECAAAGPEEVRQHPTLRKHARAAASARRFIARHAPKRKAKP